jgi:hypothetical protein
MATTTNYGWTTPDDTSLVKDGASAIRSLGTAIDTTTKNLNPQTTTGAIAYRSTTSNVNTSLPIGTAGQVLTVNSGATAPEWTTISTGGMTLLSTTTLSGATVTISGISTSYNGLEIHIYGVTNATADGEMRLAPNGSTTISTTRLLCIDANGSTTGTLAEQNTFLRFNQSTGIPSIESTSSENYWIIQIPNYSQTTYEKIFQLNGMAMSTANVKYSVSGFGRINTTSAITSLVFSNSGGNLSTGTVLLYGVK